MCCITLENLQCYGLVNNTWRACRHTLICVVYFSQVHLQCCANFRDMQSCLLAGSGLFIHFSRPTVTLWKKEFYISDWQQHRLGYCIQIGPKKESYCTLFISSLSVDQFSQFFTSKFCKKFATQWHAHHTYYVATLSCRIWMSKNIQYLQMDRSSNGNFFKVFNSDVKIWVTVTVKNFRGHIKHFLK